MAKAKEFDPDLGERIKDLRSREGLSQDAFGALFGVEQASVSRWEKGFYPKRTLWRAIADRAGVTPQEFIYGQALQVPLLTKVAASSFSYSDDILSENEIEKYVSVGGLGPGRWVAMPVFGDSMDRVAPDGATIFVNLNDREPKDELYYVFRLRKETTFKRFFEDPDRLEACSILGGHRSIFFDDEIEVVGRVRRVLTAL